MEMKVLIKSGLLILLAVFLVGALIPVNAFADVQIYAEGAYTESDLALYLYADINASTELRSAGVKLTYNPSELTVATAEKNESVWFLGSEPYMDPDTSTSGEVVIILGKLDTGDATAGVSGARVLLGKVRFNRTENSMPFSPTLGLAYGKRGPENKYANFVDTANPANVLDDTAAVTFGTITVRERGDADASGSINISDVTEIRKMVFNQVPKTCYADCDDSGDVNISDVTCIRNKVFQ